MFKRIKTIKNVGRFIKCPNIQLGNIVLVYGPNCYGKSTLSDIFRSLDTRNPTPILKRKSIGQNTLAPEISLTFIADQSTTENEITFTNNLWQLPNFNYQVEVFDSRFIEDNVFTGLTIPRANKENLTNLILGEQSVDLAKQIKELKQKYTEKSKEIGELEELLKRELGILNLGVSLEEFIKVEKPTNISAIKSRISLLQGKKKRLEKSITEKSKILSLVVPQQLTSPDCVSSIVEIKKFLQREFENLNDDAYKKLEEHIKNHIANRDGSEEQWIKEGVRTYLKTHQEKIKDSNCPFCSQLLAPVKDLIQTYQTLFSNEYEDFCDETEGQLEEGLEGLLESERDIESMKTLILNNYANSQRYQQYIDEDESDAVGLLENQEKNLKKAISQLELSLSKAKKEIENKKEEKIKKPFLKIETAFDLREIKSQQKQLYSVVKEYNDVIEDISESLNELKNKTKKNELEIEVENISQLLKRSEVELKRYELSSDIDKLLLLGKEKKEIEAKKDEAQSRLEQNNRTFVDKYFKETTSIFNTLGSVDFKIKPCYTRRGGQPVYEPIIEFNGEEVTDDRISYVFSDADRRALAFSIFLARIKKKDKDEWKNTIIILDDPVISYDDNRISQTLRQVKILAVGCRQVIILAHYSKFLLETYEILKSIPELEVIFLEIKREDGGSVFGVCDDPHIRLDFYAQEIEKIQRFISGDSTVNPTDARRSLRPILQKELEWRYRRGLRGVKYSGLGELVSKLKESRLIKEDLAQEIYSFNDVLQGDHHDIDDNSPEDTRTLARNVLDFIYQKLNP
ncbi:MAG: AAA family ATPase [Candidatus Pacebacteria bacterium]|nr:AAA family ATPase [Candidatus Paceibacterota bacterium]